MNRTAPAAKPVDPFGEPIHEPGLSFSLREVGDLAAAVVLLSLAFALALGCPINGWIPRPVDIAIALIAVASGFVLHELAHKLVAQRFGHWAEFRAQYLMLAGSFALAVFAKLLFAAPGAVLIRGRVTVRENGLISLVGPGVNVLLAGISFAVFFSTRVVNNDTFAAKMWRTTAIVNAGLAILNLVPLGPFDGRKVLAWNGWVWALAMGAAMAMGVVGFLYSGGFPTC